MKKRELKGVLISQWTCNPEEEEIGGMEIGKLSQEIFTDLEDAGFQFSQIATDSGCDEEMVESVVKMIEDDEIPKDGMTIHNNEGHYVNVVNLKSLQA